MTIGDGLIAQIPALFISITAGIIVTRVADESDESANLGRDISAQVGKQPRALLVAACMLVVFAFVPGFPAPVFLVLAAALGAPAALAVRAARRQATRGSEESLAPSEVAEPVESAEGAFSAARDEIYAPTVPLMVELGSEAAALASGGKLRDEINRARLAVYYRLGVSLPVIETRAGRALEGGSYRIFVGEIPAAEGALRGDSLFVLDRKKIYGYLTFPLSPASRLWRESKACGGTPTRNGSQGRGLALQRAAGVYCLACRDGFFRATPLTLLAFKKRGGF